MSQDTINLELQERSVVGKGLSGLRHEGHVPVVVHDHGNPSIHAQAQYLTLTKIFSKAGKHHPVELKIGKQDRLALIKDVDIDPVKNRMRHIVFQAIRTDEEVETEVPVHIEGEIPAVKSGLMVINNLDHIVIQALPKFLIDEIKVSGEKLVEIGDKITVADLILPPNITVMTEAEHPIATVEETKAQESEEEVAEEVEEGEEGSEAASKEGDAESGEEAKD